MKKTRVARVSFPVVVVMLIALVCSPTAAAQESDERPIVSFTVEANEVSWQPQVDAATFNLTISGPGDFYLQQVYLPGELLPLRVRKSITSRV